MSSEILCFNFRNQELIPFHLVVALLHVGMTLFEKAEGSVVLKHCLCVCQNFESPQYTSREPSDVLKNVEVGVRGHNKVSALAKDLADKFSADRKPPPPPPQEPRPVSY